MFTAPADDTLALLTLNQHLLAQAIALATAHTGPGGPRYAGLAGSHLRHVVEHYEALLFRAEIGAVNYDARPRDAELDVDPHLARARLLSVHDALGTCALIGLDVPLRVRGQGGPAGDLGFAVTSSLGRELVFLAGHTVHHFALLAGYCRQHGIPTPEGFGKAPATRAHERAGQAMACA
jgi:hypothetical protein